MAKTPTASIGTLIDEARARANRPPLPKGGNDAPEAPQSPKARRVEGYEKMPRDSVSLND